MVLLILATAWAALVAWLICRAVIQFHSYRTVAPVGPPNVAAEAMEPTVTIIIPARNEAAHIGPCLNGVLAQNYPADKLSVIVVDDQSSDRTREMACRFARRDPRVHVVDGAPLPSGWTGKSHVCWQAAQRARGKWLLFLDADTVPEPLLVRSAIATATAHGDVFLSLSPFQELETFWERIVIPAGMFVAACTEDLRQFEDAHDPAATANGQCLLVNAAVYRRLGGHEAVCDQIAEDKALASLFKRAGYRVPLVGAEKLVRTRMYTNLRELWEGLSKNLCDRFAGVFGTGLAAAGGLLSGLASISLPAWALGDLIIAPSAASLAALCLAAAASLALLGMHIGTAIHLRIPWWYGLLFPFAYLVDAALALHAIRISLRGAVPWKGRIYRNAAKTNGVPI